jgi:hypothetical protein
MIAAHEAERLRVEDALGLVKMHWTGPGAALLLLTALHGECVLTSVFVKNRTRRRICEG